MQNSHSIIITSTSELSLEIPPIELEDGNVVDILQVTFKDEDQTIQRCATTSNNLHGEQRDKRLSCTVTFHSLRPVSFSTRIRFIAGDTR